MNLPPRQTRPLWRQVLPGLLLVVALAWLAFRQPQTTPADDRLVTRDLFALGTLVHVGLYLESPEQRPAAQAAMDQALEMLSAFERRWSVRGDGELAQFNRSLSLGEAAQVPAPLIPLMEKSWALQQQSGGLFDPRVGALVSLWGFDEVEHFRQTPPHADAIQAKLESLSQAPAYVSGEAYGPAPGILWDLGGIAKGHAIDRLSKQLRQAGFEHHIINAGGNLLASGRRGDRAWKIGIRHPRADQTDNPILAALQTRGLEAVITSGDYERSFMHEDQRFHHILDPRTGFPASGAQSVSVIHADAATADAASTALFVAGDQWPVLARQMALDAVMVVDANGEIFMTPALADRIELAPGEHFKAVP
ncbi:MAG: FAD:protein FMN transferase [Panacagrimonas sp.]